jgi:hypothetical protein
MAVTVTETVATDAIQQAVIEKLALLSLEQQRQVLEFADEMAQPKKGVSSFRAMFEDAARDVPAEAWDEVPADASSNIDRYLNQKHER